MVQTYLIVIIHFFHFIVDLHDICAAWITEKVRNCVSKKYN